MKNRKWIITSLTIMFVVLTGILYSCRTREDQNSKISLQNLRSTLEQEQLTSETLDTQEVIRADEIDKQAMNEDSQKEQGTKKESEENVKSDESSSAKRIFIHICGAVKKPDVYEIAENSRLIDIIKLAGGLTEAAAGDYVNQAALVVDGQQVYIPTKKEVEGITPIDYNSNISDNTTNSVLDKSSNKININNASMEELMTLTGIGESKAKSIIEYRQNNGDFKSIEEIKNINGIKDAVYNNISNLISIK